MKIICSSNKLISKFKALIPKSNQISLLTAWATNSNPLSDLLFANSSKIDKAVVGLKFYQTDPEFIKRYQNNERVKYIKNDTSGVFHPKVYLFETDKEWHLFIGSPNFTKQGFTKNFEVTSYFRGNSVKDGELIKIKNIIKNTWINASNLSKEEIKSYARIHQMQKDKIKSLSGQYGNDKKGKKNGKPIYSIPILNLTWGEYIDKIKESEDEWKIEGRIELLDITKKYFKKYNSLIFMDKNQRQEIGGINSNQNLIYGSFGTMSARGNFTSFINNITKKPLLSKALDEIPLTGNISRDHYMKYIEKFSKVFDSKEIAGATRLLTIKRPDIFVNFNTKNKNKLCEEFEISKNIDYEGYWDSIIRRIQDAVWWKKINPKNDFENSIVNKKAAFLDSIFYEK